MKYDVITIGDAFEDVFVTPDLTVHSDRALASGKGIMFELGEKIPLESVDYDIGGSACNTAVGFSRLGFKTGIISLLGDDTPKEKVLDRLEEEDVDTKNLIIDNKAKTGFSVIFNLNGDRTVFVYHAVKNYQDLKIKGNLKTKWFFLAPLGEETKALEDRLVREVAENNSLLAWNPGSKQIAKGASHYRHLLKCTSILFLNREEAMKFVDFPVRPRMEEIMEKIHNYGPSIVVVTSGAEGAKAYDGQTFYSVDSRHVQVADSTGAGDAFATGFLARLIGENWKEDIPGEIIQQALRWGINNSVSVIQSIGAQKGLLTQTNIKGE